MQKVLFFVDTDKDDLYSLCLICAQHYYGIIDVIGIVVESGFIENIQDGLLITQQWLHILRVGTNLDNQDYGFPFSLNLYAGYNRPAYLDNRIFPNFLISGYLNVLKHTFNITIPNYDYETNMFTDQIVETGAPSCDVLFIETQFYEKKSILCLTTSPVTTLAIALDKYGYLTSKIDKIYSMISNYLVPGNVFPQVTVDANITLPNPYDAYSGEFNAFLNPYSFQRVCLSSTDNIDVNIIPLDCTNYAPLTKETVVELNAIADPFLYYCKDPWITNLCIQFILSIDMTLNTQDEKIYLWDLCATNIALQSNVDAHFILGAPIIDVVGKINQYYYDSNPSNKVKIYNFLNYQKLLVNSIRIIFNDPKYKD